MTPEQWDTHWMRICSQLQDDGVPLDESGPRADVETVEQFGPRPQEAT